MTGQEAVNVAQSFHEQLELTGVVLTKLDGDTRGGAALSVKAVTGCPIKFAATGEKIEPLEPFHPERMASRILGMGDMLSLIEKAQASIDAEKAAEMERKMRTAEFTFDDFLEQMEQVRKLGPLDQLLDMMPGMGKMKGHEESQGRREANRPRRSDRQVDDEGREAASPKSQLTAGASGLRPAAELPLRTLTADQAIRRYEEDDEAIFGMMGPKGPKGGMKGSERHARRLKGEY